ncbi:anucleate primary sterigmata protein A [Paracoccidioides lutzii Pb01]|uniref:Anucleate primary sterigmata protein A n=1 Tax=Paracoccidioides lutzii (strain ATCC MYA-826 / Pb01) TaxID=502779 RepID=C1H210_PARBA|nr:anucleate primary sterigmata protein A [Paracoccidioides lutzii Pb01]EEH33897.2 anucleate primary sterigmata protein A [Paracoccidioides lutzii Pb01]
MEDPFISDPAPASSLLPQQRESHRYSSFGSQLFTLNASSPSQVKRALEAHLAETERRLQDASKLGTALVQQQKELSDKLKEIEHQQDEGEIGPDLRRKLADLEKEYNEIGRETARVSLGPKPRLVPADEEGSLSLDGRTLGSPAVLSSQATSSPTKVTVPSRRQRNQQSSRVHDIEFATEISTSLLAQVRQLQGLLVDREETIKAINLEKSRLELEAEAFTQRLRALDESEQRYKDENWNLETQIQELLASAKEASVREARLTTNLNAATAENATAQRKLDELKQVNEKLIEDNTATQKTYDSELHILRRIVHVGDTERNILQQKVDELTNQNQELAKAVAAKIRQHEAEGVNDVAPRDNDDEMDEGTPEHSPPPSPNKATPRHGHLESETLKSSLYHAHRMIQNLKNNIHREKTEKMELKRMLQEARDEVEQRRVETHAPPSANKRQRVKQDVFRKPARPEMLGARRGFAEIEIGEPDWEEHTVEASPTRKLSGRFNTFLSSVRSRSDSVDASDAYQTTNETEDAFETANERETATESEAFQTGAESLGGDTSEEELTETESRSGPATSVRSKKSTGLSMTKASDWTSFMSTSSTSDEDFDVDYERTPIQALQPQRYRLKMTRTRERRGRASGDSMAPVCSNLSAQNSPATSVSQAHPLIIPSGQSLFAELEDQLNGPDSGSDFGTPRYSTTVSQTSTPNISRFNDQCRPSEATSTYSITRVMVDSGTMTESWQPSQTTPDVVASLTPVEAETTQSDTKIATESGDATEFVDSATQYTPRKGSAVDIGDLSVALDTPPKTIWDVPVTGKQRQVQSDMPESPILTPLLPLELHISPILSEETMPVAPTINKEQPPQPIPQLDMSSITYEETYPVPALVKAITPPALVFSPIQTETTEPLEPSLPKAVKKPTQQLKISPIFTAETEPVEPQVLCGVVAQTKLFDAENSSERPNTAVDINEISSHSIVGFNSVDVGTDPIFLISSTVDKSVKMANVGEDEKKKDVAAPFADNIFSQIVHSSVAPQPAQPVPHIPAATTENSVQTILTATQIDQLLIERSSRRAAAPSVEADTDGKQLQALVEGASGSLSTPKARLLPSTLQKDTSQPPQTAVKRPGSACSQRRGSITSYPPLPPDHKQAIAAASQRRSLDVPSSGTMGPPLAPASAFRTNAQSRTRTPNDQASSMKNGVTPRAHTRRSSQISRRSSVSSFASELDVRFNMNNGGYPFQSGTDPRMIQAITQTMIGEFLWKYTRRTVRPDLSSNTRHQRYFWVHPYTRTLYWSDQDPQSAGKSQHKAKSVAIEAVRVVNDDNPYPPGLHRKSLEIITPGRIVKLTASTSQRHETWFNALSYLLLRTAGEETAERGDNLTQDDVDEFNPSIHGSSRPGGSRMSIASRTSRNARTYSVQYPEPTLTVKQPAISGRASPALSSGRNSTSRVDVRHGSVSRLSTMFRTSVMSGTLSSRRSRYDRANENIDNSNATERDSTENLRQLIEQQEMEADLLENVRACCDGKHDVSSLSRTSRYSSRASRLPHKH